MHFPSQLSEVFDFGRYTGRTVEDIIHENPQYVAWLIENHKEFYLAPGAARYLKDELIDLLDTAKYFDEHGYELPSAVQKGEE